MSEAKEHPPKVRVHGAPGSPRSATSVVDSETDALLLENSTSSRSLQPRYNILLKDDKTYPWIVVRRENFPRIQSTRQLQRDGSQYFGPYSSVTMQHSILEFIREVIPLRTCSLNLAPEAIARGRYTVCLQYHLGQLQGAVHRRAERRGVPAAARHGRLGAQRRPAPRARLPRRGDAPRRRGVAVRDGAALQITARCIGELFGPFGHRQRPHRRTSTSSRSSTDDDAAYCNFLRIRNGSITAVSTVRLTPGRRYRPRANADAGHSARRRADRRRRTGARSDRPLPCRRLRCSSTG